LQKLTYIIFISLLISACGSSRNISSGNPTVKRTTEASPKFIENIHMTPGENGPGAGNEANTGRLSGPGNLSGNTTSVNIENGTELQFKYAILLDEPVEKQTNLFLLQFIDDWFGTRYQYGGSTKAGVDCSAFVCALENSVYGKTLPRTSREQFDQSQKIGTIYLQQGDLVFFNTRGGVSHVGVYLSNNKFVHASTSSGVTISDLDEEYYKRRFVGAGRL
jgi:hypothetical protein